jgi:cyclic pyranopterin phosphate synthase
MKIIQRIANALGRDNTIKLLRFHAELKNTLKYGDPDHFQQVFIEISGKCNRTCFYCPNSVNPQADENMDRERFVKILSRLQEIRWTGVVAYHFLNEPTLHPHFVEFVRLTREMLPKAKPTLFTNGDFLTPALAQQLVEAGLVRSTVTRHPPVPPDWDARVKEVCRLFPAVFHENRIKPTDLMNPAGIMEKFNNEWKGTCNSPKRVLIIRRSGQVGICCCDHVSEARIGNVLTTPIDLIWRDPVFQDTRRRLQAGERVYEICKNCSGVE